MNSKPSNAMILNFMNQNNKFKFDTKLSKKKK